MDNDVDDINDFPIDDEPTIIEDFLEFKTFKTVISSGTIVAEYYVNVKKDEISEISQFVGSDGMVEKNKCTIVMRNGVSYDLLEPYEKVMELV